MNKLERRALLGDKQAQEECTRRGIALQCPCCGEKVEAIMNGQYVYHVKASCLAGSRFISLSVWNDRPAPPIGRCKDCAERNNGDGDLCFHGSDDDFCSGFRPKEEEE